MSQLDKLAIRGIRSFDPHTLSTIQFYTPLTVIVGHNGSGKTTVIECLKYATTGDMPPNTKGGAFVHDPTIAGANEIKATVKLRLYNKAKTRIMVERRVQVTKKGTTGALTMKTLEGTINYDDENIDKRKRDVLSTKCAELNEEVPKQLGVSKAILDNVIFCHQEESNWPLSDPASLKKKFDDIFEATRYTKALAEIVNIRKAQVVELKVQAEKLIALKTDRERARKLTETLDKLNQKIADKSIIFDDLKRANVKASNETKEFYNEATKVVAILNEAKTLDTKISLTEAAIQQLRDGLIELSGTDAELAAQAANHDATLRAIKEEKVVSLRRVNDETDILNQAERKRSACLTELGTVLAQKDRYDRVRVERQALISSLSVKHEITGFDHAVNDEKMKEFVERLDDLVENQLSDIEKLKREARKSESDLINLIQSLKSKQAADERAKSTLQQQINSINAQINRLTDNLDRTLVNEGDIKLNQQALDDCRIRKVKGEADLKALDIVTYLRQKTTALRGLDEEREGCHADMTKLNSVADIRARRDLQQKELSQKKEAIQALVDKNSESYLRFVKTEPVANEMEDHVNAVLSAFEKDIDVADNELRRATKSLQEVETRITLGKKRISEVKSKADALEKVIKAGLDQVPSKKTLAATIQDAVAEEAFVFNLVEQSKGSTNLFSTVLSRAKEVHLCYGCNRGLSNKEMLELEEYVKKQIEKAPKDLEGLLLDLNGWRDQLSDLNELLPHQVAHDLLIQHDLIAAQASLAEDEQRLPDAASLVETCSTHSRDLKIQLRDLQLLKRASGDVVRMHRECESLRHNVGLIDEDLRSRGTTQSSETIQGKIKVLTQQINEMKTQIESKRLDEQNQTKNNQTLRSQINELENSLRLKKQQLAEKDALEKDKLAANEQLSLSKAQLLDLDEKLRMSRAPLASQEKELSYIRSTATTAESLASRSLQSYLGSQQKLASNMNEIKTLEGAGLQNKIAQCQVDVQQCEQAVSDARNRIVALQQAVVDGDKKVSEGQSTARNISHNIKYRESMKVLQRTRRELMAIDTESAKKSSRRFEADYECRRSDLSKNLSEEARLGGEIATMEEDQKEKARELATEYKDINSRYKHELISNTTMQTANEDLNKFGKALDAAIMSFHGAKMKEINESIDALWMKTYQGTDIDKIMIKSDADAKAAGAKSYNYRVVMVKDGTEMDMRGRCSAGQKVLASIIIRLALADSFSNECGILALDEPTTNLDRENIQALSQALADLINERKSQKNFQLIVITHDESFLQILGGKGHLKRYWRIARVGGQTSTINRQHLS